MARIRSIKPEFPQSESMGRVSRDARLLFVELWTICDDSGRTRAASRMLASLLFPYDDDAPSLIDGWLSELEREGCLSRYEVEGNTYLEIHNWLNHQKIDKPSQSKIPSFANAREPSESAREKLPRIKEGIKEGSGDSANKCAKSTPEKRKTTIPDGFDISERVKAWAEEKGHSHLADHLDSFRSKCRAKGYTYVDWDDAFMEAVRKNWANVGISKPADDYRSPASQRRLT
jgi:hypothetical protein